MTTNPNILESGCEWRAGDVADEAAWTEIFTEVEIGEIDDAIVRAQAKSPDLLDIGRDDFPLPTLSRRLKAIEDELINGRGFVRLRGLDRERYSNDDMCLI